jgi:hypothetical protein
VRKLTKLNPAHQTHHQTCHSAHFSGFCLLGAMSLVVQVSHSINISSSVKQRTVKWCRSTVSPEFPQLHASCLLFSQSFTLSPHISQQEPSQGDEASDMVMLDEDFPVSHTCTVTLNVTAQTVSVHLIIQLAYLALISTMLDAFTYSHSPR